MSDTFGPKSDSPEARFYPDGEPCDPSKFDFNLNFIWHVMRFENANLNKIHNLIATSGLCSSDQSLLYRELQKLATTKGAQRVATN